MKAEANFPIDWRDAPSPLELPAGGCDIWRVDLSAAPTEAQHVLLDAAERQRAERFRSQRDRERFACCRAALRTILARYLRRDPAELLFSLGQHGRPFLCHEPALEFNVTHSGELALIAVSVHGPLGIDLEVLRDMPRAASLAARYFHPNERAAIETALPADRSRLLLSGWVRKEAALKSTGLGIAYGPARIDTGIAFEERVLSVSVNGARQHVRIVSFSPADGYVGACALPAGHSSIRYLNLAPP